MIYAISGSHGYVGENLVKTLLDKGHEVLRLPRDIKEVELESADYVIHLATYGNSFSQGYADETIDVNLIGTKNLLTWALNKKVKGFVNVSSSSVLLPYETFYSATKAGAERLCKAYANVFSLPVVSVRPSTIIGKGEQSEHLIPKLINSCLTGEEMPFVEDATHDYIDVRDVVKGMIHFAEHAEEYKGKSFNLSKGVTCTNADVKRIVEELTNKKANVKIVDSLRAYDTQHWEVDNTETLEAGWKPEYSLYDSIKSML